MLMIGNQKAYDTGEVAQILNVTSNAVRRLIRDKRIKAVNLGRGNYITYDELAKFLETRKPKKQG